MTTEFFVWLPDPSPRFVNLIGPPVDDDGKELTLYNTMEAFPGRGSINLQIDRIGEISDFVNNVGHMLIVSNRTLQVVRQANTESVAEMPVRIWRKKKVEAEGLFWLNLKTIIPMLDEEMSKVKKTKKGNYFGIENFHVRAGLEVHQDLFVCKETNSKIFTAGLVELIRDAGLSGGIFNPLQGYNWPFFFNG